MRALQVALLADPPEEAGGGMTTVCAWCEAEKPIDQRTVDRGQLSHGICAAHASEERRKHHLKTRTLVDHGVYNVDGDEEDR